MVLPYTPSAEAVEIAERVLGAVIDVDQYAQYVEQKIVENRKYSETLVLWDHWLEAQYADVGMVMEEKTAIALIPEFETETECERDSRGRMALIHRHRDAFHERALRDLHCHKPPLVHLLALKEKTWIMTALIMDVAHVAMKDLPKECSNCSN